MARGCDGCTECEESWSEHRGYLAAAQMLPDQALSRVCAAGAPHSTPDYQSECSAVEIKELTSGTVKKFQEAMGEQPTVTPSSLLTRTWLVWPSINWSAEFDGDRAPRVKGFVDQLAPLLAKLEAEGADNNYAASVDLYYAINRLVGGGYCAVLDPSDRFEPGVLLGYAIAGERPGHIDDAVVDVLQAWLDRESAKMRRSLEAEQNRLRCGVLVASDDGLQPVAARLTRSLNWDFPDELPTRNLLLPSEMDVFIVVAGDTILKYDGARWWRGART